MGCGRVEGARSFFGGSRSPYMNSREILSSIQVHQFIDNVNVLNIKLYGQYDCVKATGRKNKINTIESKCLRTREFARKA